MEFPSSSEIRWFADSLKLEGLKQCLLSAHPDLRAVTSLSQAQPMALGLDLPPDRRGFGRRVVAGRVATRSSAHWLIVGARSTELMTSIWDLATHDEVLRDAIVATYRACMAESDLPSPWRWAEAERSFIVRVADALVVEGVAVSAVAQQNRLVPDATEGASSPRPIPLAFGEALRLEADWGNATLSRKPTLGWVLDADDHLITRRLDLGYFMNGVSSKAPGLEAEDPEELASAVARATRTATWQPTDGHIRLALFLGDSPLHEAVAWWMRQLGYPETETHDRYDGPVFYGDWYIHVATRRCTLSDVKTAYADAAMDGRPLIMFGTRGFTRDAAVWAVKARIPAFNIAGEDYQLSASNALAEEHVPQGM